MSVNHTTPMPVSAELLANPDAFLSKGNVLWLLSLTDESLRQRIKKELFPRPDLMDGKRPRWLVSTFRDWQAGALKADITTRRKDISRALETAPAHRLAELQREDRQLLARERQLERAARRDSLPREPHKNQELEKA